MRVSRKFLRELIEDYGPFAFDEIIAKLDEKQVSYPNYAFVQGLLQDGIDRRLWILEEGKFAKRPRGSTGGQPPSSMYRLQEDFTIKEAPINEELVRDDPLWCTTPLAAVRAAKTYFYNKEYVPTMEKFHQLEKECLADQRGQRPQLGRRPSR